MESLSRQRSFARKALTVALAGSVACAATISGVGAIPAYAETADVKDGIQTEGNLKYLVDAYDCVTILGLADDFVTELVIPDNIAGKPVTAIAEDAFRRASLRSVVIPDSVRSIGDSAFQWCSSLKTIKMPAELDYLGELVFYDCGDLTDVVLPQGSYEIRSHAFSTCESLQRIVIPAGVASIGTGAFSDCSELMEVNLPASVGVDIADDAFEAIGIGSIISVQTRSQFNFFSNGHGISTGRSKVIYEEGYPLAVTAVELNESSLELDSGETIQLKATVSPEAASDAEVKWSSSNESIATVNDDGMVTAITTGEATITADAEGSKAVCKVTVRPDFSVELYGDPLTVSIRVITSEDVTWAVDDTSIVQILRTGSTSINNYKNAYCVLSPKSVGITTLSCYVGSSLHDTATIEVTPGKKVSISGASISGLEAEYGLVDGGVKPKPTVTVDGKTLVEGTDYTLSYKNNTTIGTATLTVTGVGRYEGAKSVDFKIVEATQDISKATVSGLEEEYGLVDGGVKPEPVVTMDGKVLQKGADYTLAYSDNAAVGTGHITITGKGKYKGTKIVDFKIIETDLSKATISGLEEEYELIEDGVKPKLEVTLNGKTLVEDTDYMLAYSDNKAVGTGHITITGKGKYKGTKTVDFKIVENVHDITKAVVAGVEESYVFEGDPIYPEPVVTLGGKTLVKGVDYSIKYIDNGGVGTASLVITGLGDYKGEKTVEFKIVERLKVFADVNESDWCHDVVYTAYDNGYINGYSGTDLFGPWNDITRGQVACVLYNMADGKLGEEQYPLYSFSDVAMNMYYTDAVAWAKASGVVNGYGDGTFKPENPISAEEFAAMLANYARLTEDWSVDDPEAVLEAYPDGDEVSEWARTVVAWAVSEGVMGNGGILDPTGAIYRARVAAMAVNFQPEPLA